MERFLRKVQVHPELEGAPSLAAFFSPDADVFEAAKKVRLLREESIQSV